MQSGVWSECSPTAAHLVQQRDEEPEERPLVPLAPARHRSRGPRSAGARWPIGSGDGRTLVQSLPRTLRGPLLRWPTRRALGRRRIAVLTVHTTPVARLCTGRQHLPEEQQPRAAVHVLQAHDDAAHDACRFNTNNKQ